MDCRIEPYNGSRLPFSGALQTFRIQFDVDLTPAPRPDGSFLLSLQVRAWAPTLPPVALHSYKLVDSLWLARCSTPVDSLWLVW